MVLSPWAYAFPPLLSRTLAPRLASLSADPPLPLPQAIGGTIWHGIKGFRNSPYGERRIGAITAVKMRAPVLGGNFGVWGGLFSTFDCAVKGIRKKEDPYNAIIAGFFTGGSLAVRGGYKAARNGAIGCAVLLAVIEGVGIAFQRMLAGSTKLEVSNQAGPSRQSRIHVFNSSVFLRCHHRRLQTTTPWYERGLSEELVNFRRYESPPPSNTDISQLL